MAIQAKISLRPFNTFGLDATVEYYAQVTSRQDLLNLLKNNHIQPIWILGGGSNLLLTDNLPGLLIHNAITGIETVKKFKNKVWVKIGAGENWHHFVQWAVDHNFGGVENLSLIPGTAGAAPVQNIGAYGVELKDVFVSLEAVELSTGKLRHFNRAQCRFGYRDSVFKTTLKNQFCILSVTLSLNLNHHHLKTGYGDIRRELEKMGVQTPSISHVSQAVIAIRSAKLPDPAQIGNSGSFFKNPEIDQFQFEQLQQRYPQMPHYLLPDHKVKIPAGWLIEQAGWKGKKVGNTGSYANQALVLVNYGNASGKEVAALAYAIIEDVQLKFGICLSPEVNFWPS